MAIAEVGGGTQRATFRYANVDSGTAAFPANVTSGNLLMTCLGNWHLLTAVSITVSDTRSTSYTTLLAATGLAWAGGTGKEAIAYGIAPSSGACTMTIDPIAVTGNYFNAVLDEFSGVDSSPIDVDGSESTGTTADSAFTEGLTTLTNNDLVVGVAICDGTAGQTAGSGYTLLDTDGTAVRQPYAAVFKVAGAAGPETVTVNTDTARNWAMSSAAFKETQVGGQPLLLRLQHLPHLSTVRPQYGRW